ncbi:MAG: mandelate racemase/muconate lactonizing enzyme family protein [Haloferacaceae archaeon]
MRLRDFSLDLAEPLETAKGEITSRRGVLVGVDAGQGDVDAGHDTPRAGGDAPARGVGEATPLPGWTESLEACRDALATHADEGPGEALAALEADHRPAARHGLSLAVLDSVAREAGESLAARLADRESAVAERVPVNATIGGGTPAEAVAAAERAVDAGYECLKLKAGLGALPLDLRRVRVVRDAVGDGVTLRVDANGSWTPAVAERAIESLSALGVSYVEQPVPAADLAAMADLRGRGVGVAADEALAEHDLDSVLDADAADVVVLKPMALGGIDRAREAARAARRAGVDVVVTTTIDGAVARAGAVHLAASLPDVLPCGLATGELLAEDFVDDLAPVEDGAVAVPDGPGIAGGAFDDLVWNDGANADGA